MRILHVGNVAGVATFLSRAQRKIGHKSDVAVFWRHPFEYEEDYVYSTRPSSLKSLHYLYHVLTKWGPNYDIFHFHDGPVTTLRLCLDFPTLKHIFRKKIVYLYHGTSLRVRGYREYYENFNKKLRKIYVSTPDLLEYTRREVEWVPNPIDLNMWQPIEKESSNTVRILHYPTTTRQYLKGASPVESALNRLEKDGYKIEKLFAVDVPHNEIPALIASSDIVIDKVVRAIGWYGMLAVEALAMRKPVLAYINPRLRHFMPFDPFIETTPETLYEDLKTLVEDKTLRKSYGEKGRKYVESVHDSMKVSSKWLEIYNSDD